MAATPGSPGAPGAGGSSLRVAARSSAARGTSVAPGSRPVSGPPALPLSARGDGEWLIVSSATSRLLRDNAATLLRARAGSDSMRPQRPGALVVLGQLPGRTQPESCPWRRDAATLTLAAIARYSARSLRVAASALLSCAKARWSRARRIISLVRGFGCQQAPSQRLTKATTVRTYSPKSGDVERRWHVIDATDVVLGRLASQAATLLRGKHKPTFAPHVDTGDFVVIINAGKVALTGAKREQKLAYRHSGYPGGLRAVGYVELLDKHPERAVEKAV